MGDIYNTFEQYMAACLSVALTQTQKTAMIRCSNLYMGYHEEGYTPEQAMEEEWG
jgi:hypothetical protein